MEKQPEFSGNSQEIFWGIFGISEKLSRNIFNVISEKYIVLYFFYNVMHTIFVST